MCCLKIFSKSSWRMEEIIAKYLEGLRLVINCTYALIYTFIGLSMGSVVGVRNAYVDYLLSTEGHISAVDLSAASAGKYSHDRITRMLAEGDIDDKLLYTKGKRLIKQKGTTGVVTL